MIDIILGITYIIVPILISIYLFKEIKNCGNNPEYEEWKRNNP